VEIRLLISKHGLALGKKQVLEVDASVRRRKEIGRSYGRHCDRQNVLFGGDDVDAKGVF
jgi:hypothetical protein